ncbi:hypothetical protein PHMEG_00023337 [Phytophthora megakarya]|uniref:Uncharacterized protein n=1 Tax=Phytophthora megakarya TaxID=4795 RepID=A0A225VIY4_9STRA|nr:hypothetical protein PHMEG_00023337 [Phytophthora megakarya]
MNLFLNGLSDSIMKQKFLRKRLSDLNAAIQEVFLEWELKDKHSACSKSANNRLNNTMVKMETPQQADSGKQSLPTIRRLNYGGKIASNSSKSVKNCSFAGEGHTESRIVGLIFPKNTQMQKPRRKKDFHDVGAHDSG